MSRKTKADLEADIQALQRENDILRSEIEMLHYLLDTETEHRKILETVHNSEVAKIVSRDTSRVRKEVKAFHRKKYLQSRYAEHRKDNNITKSRDKANDDIAKKFGERHRLKERRLKELCKD